MKTSDLEILLRDHLRTNLPDEVIVGLLDGDIRDARPAKDLAVYLQYKGSGLSTPRPTQERRASFEVYVGARSQRSSDNRVGVLDLLDDVREVLSGYRFPDVGTADGKVFATSENTLFYDKNQHLYWYYMTFAARMTWTP